MFTSQQLQHAIEAVTGASPAAPVWAVVLSGGYSWTTLLVTDAAGSDWILRIAPPGGTVEPYDPAAEAAWIERSAGSVSAPAVLGVDRSGTLLGAPMAVHSRVPGEVLSLSDVPESDRGAYRETFARTLGRLHAGGRVPDVTVEAALSAEWRSMYDEYRSIALHRHPGFEVGLRWLRARLPAGRGPAVLCHGDYRFANISWTAPGSLGGVLDWERAWVGDPMCDLAFTRQFSGWCAIDADAVAIYEDAADITVEGHRVDYGLRFERVRAYLSPLRLMRAFAEGRVDDPRLVTIAEAGEAGMWDLVAWGSDTYLPPLEGDHPLVEGLDWTAGITDPEAREHFDRHPRPAPPDSSDALAISEAVQSWSERPLLRRRRPWH